MYAPTVEDVQAYLGATSWTLEQITSAFNSEAGAQRRRCLIPTDRAVVAMTTAGSAVLLAVADTFKGRDLGATVTGAGIPDGATVVSVDNDAQVTLSAAATAAGVDVPLTLVPDLSDLAEALNRRVAHNLALRNLPLGVQASISEGGVATNKVAGLDAEVAVKEAPYRRVVVG